MEYCSGHRPSIDRKAHDIAIIPIYSREHFSWISSYRREIHSIYSNPEPLYAQSVLCTYFYRTDFYARFTHQVVATVIKQQHHNGPRMINTQKVPQYYTVVFDCVESLRVGARRTRQISRRCRFFISFCFLLLFCQSRK